jgi:hypothetical protein
MCTVWFSERIGELQQLVLDVINQCYVISVIRFLFEKYDFSDVAVLKPYGKK